MTWNILPPCKAHACSPIAPLAAPLLLPPVQQATDSQGIATAATVIGGLIGVGVLAYLGFSF